MDNGGLKGDNRTSSPIEEESFRQKILENRKKFRTADNPNGYNSETEPEWETEGGETDTDTEIKQKGSEETGSMRRSSNSSSSSSTSSESSDSDNEDIRRSVEGPAKHVQSDEEDAPSIALDADQQSNGMGERPPSMTLENEDNDGIHLSGTDDFESKDDPLSRRDSQRSDKSVDKREDESLKDESRASLPADEISPSEGEMMIPGDQEENESQSSSSSDESCNSEDEEPQGTSGGYDVNPPDSHSEQGVPETSYSSEPECEPEPAYEPQVVETINQPVERKASTSSSDSSSSDDEEDRLDSTDLRRQDEEPTSERNDSSEVEHSNDQDSQLKLPIVLDTSSSESEDEKDEEKPRDEDARSQTPDNIESKKDDQDESTSQEDNSDPAIHALHGEEAFANEEPRNSGRSSSSSSSSDSEMEDNCRGPLVIKQQDEEDIPDDKEITPLSLKKALEERERELQLKREEEEKGIELGARKASAPASTTEPTTPDYMGSYSPDAFDFNGDPSLRARTAFDFDEPVPEIPPKLPPKQRNINPIVAPDIGVRRQTHSNSLPDHTKQTSHAIDIHPNLYHVEDKTASLGRGRWSDDDEEQESFRRPHPPADRIIDFSSNPDGDHSLKRSRSRNKSGRKKSTSRRRSKEKRRSRSRSPSGSRSGHRVIDFSNKPYEDPQDAINKQAMVSLHANTYDTDAYDSVQETGDELNKLIEKANSLGYHHHYPGEAQDVFPKTKLREKKLESKHQDAFAKIVAPLPVQPPPQQVQYRAPTQSDHQSSDNSKRSSRSLSRKKRKITPPAEAVDGDDEISLAESDINRFALPSPPPEPSIPFVTEIYPSDYTEFESFSEAEFPEGKKLERASSFMSEDTIQEALQTAGESAYDTVPDNDQETDTDLSPKAKLNPIVSSNFQICSDISGSKSFPARLKEGKPPKERPGLGHLAIPLTPSAKKRSANPVSLPYFGHDFADDDDDFDRLPRRTGSVDDIPAIYPMVNPSIVVHRQTTHPKGYRPEFAQEVMVQSAPQANPPLPEKKEKKKKDKKVKEMTEKSMPQIHFKVEQPEGEAGGSLNNNLQINLLPSNDPNVINLNIRSASVNQAGPQSLPVITAQPQSYYPELPRAQNQVPVSAMVHSQPVTSVPDNQHRVVEVSAPPMVITGDELPVPAPYSNNGGVMLAGGVPTEILPNPILTTAAQRYGSTPPPAQQNPPYPTISLGAPQPFPVPPPALPATQSLPNNAVQPTAPVVNTNVSSAPIQQPPLQANNEATIVDINSPLPLPEDRHSSLPNSLREAKSPGRLHHGDSGIDLTVHDRNRRQRSRTPKGRRRRSTSRSSANRDSSSSSSDAGSRHRRRPSSQKRLRSHDYLGNAAPSNDYMEWYREKHLKPSCCYLFMKHLMFAINLIFTLAGLALVGLGVWGMVELHNNGISDPGVIFLDPLFVVMVVGFIVTLVAFHGTAGFIRDNICMLKCFGSLLVMLFIVFVVGGIMFWAMLSDVTEFTASTYRKLIQQYNHETRVGLSHSIDIMQNTFECCGIAAPGTADWPKSELFKCQVGGKCPLPDSCCRRSSDTNFKCFTSSELVHPQACIETMSTAVKNHTPVIVGVWIGVWALMIVELICIHFMCKEILYLQKIRDFLNDPVKHIKSRQKETLRSDFDDTSERSTDASESETSSSEEEYRRRKRKDRKRKARGKKKKDKKRKKEDLGRRTTSKRGRRGSYHINRSFSIQDERSHGRRSHRGSTRSRSRRGSY